MRVCEKGSLVNIPFLKLLTGSGDVCVCVCVQNYVSTKSVNMRAYDFALCLKHVCKCVLACLAARPLTCSAEVSFGCSQNKQKL